MNIPRSTNVAATYGASTVPGSQPRTTGSSLPTKGGSESPSVVDPGSGGAKDASRSRTDSLELSSQGLRLSLTQGPEAPPPEEIPAPAPKTVEETENPPLLGAKESNWQSERKSKLDRLETLVRQGQYKVDPFILDELAVRMARLMN